MVLPNGTTVHIEGTADEVATLLMRCSTNPTINARQETHRKSSRPSAKRGGRNRQQRKGPKTLVNDLAKENFFKSKRTIGEVQKKLQEKGHIYALYSLSTPLLRLTRERVLRRLKEKTGWVYVN
jgi:hypothetical protein